MNTLLLVSNLVLWLSFAAVAFLLVGTLRSLGIANWRLDQLEMTRPSRLGRDGLKPGRKAPDFTLPSVTGGDISLSHFAGRKVLLVFTQSGCVPCHDMVPEFNRVHDRGECEVVIVNNGEFEETRLWAEGVRVRFLVLVQQKFSVSKRYEVFATPFAFLIDEQGVIASSGIVGSAQYLSFVLSGVGNRPGIRHDESTCDSAAGRETLEPALSTEMTHV